MSKEHPSYERHPLYVSKPHIDAIKRALDHYLVFCERELACIKAIQLFSMDFPNILPSQPEDLSDLSTNELKEFYNAEIKAVREALDAAKKVKKIFTE